MATHSRASKRPSSSRRPSASASANARLIAETVAATVAAVATKHEAANAAAAVVQNAANTAASVAQNAANTASSVAQNAATTAATAAAVAVVKEFVNGPGLTQVITATVTATLERLGMDTQNADATRKDMVHLRQWREVTETMRKQGFGEATKWAVRAGIAALLVGAGVMIKSHIS